MKLWIGIKILSDNENFLNTIENTIPNRLDSRLWDTDQYTLYRGFDLDGTGLFYASLFFNDANDRANFKSSLGAINGFIRASNPGSYIKTSQCWHDEISGNGSSIKSDELEYSEVVE